MFMSDPDVGQSVSQCWSVGRQSGVSLVDVNDWDSASRDTLIGLLSRAPMVVPRGSSVAIP